VAGYMAHGDGCSLASKAALEVLGFYLMLLFLVLQDAAVSTRGTRPALKTILENSAVRAQP
jgi:hypothetical protein